MQQKRSFFKVFFLCMTTVALAADWSYDNVNKWSEKYKECGGKMQSPINIDSRRISRSSIPSLKISNYKSFLSGVVKVQNNGHSIMAEPNDTIADASNALITYVTPDGQTFKYKPQSFHFHWGAQYSKGSEHKIDGKQFDAEMHIVHKNVDENVDPKYGLAVFGIMVEAGSSGENIKALDEVFKSIDKVKKAEAVTYIKDGLNLEEILNRADTQLFYNYQGSLTTPPCTEAVSWFVFSDPVEVQRSQLKRFFGVRDSHGHKLVKNFRPVQDLNGRSVYSSSELANLLN